MIWIAIALTFYLFDKKCGRHIAAITLLALLFTYLINDQIVKHLVSRARPFTELQSVTVLVQEPLSSSFPSGHSATAFACATVLAYKKKFGFLFYPLAVFIVYSRIYVGVHYPLDVVAGLLIGLTMAFAVLKNEKKIINMLEEMRRRYNKR